MTLLERGGIPNIQTETYICNSENEVKDIPTNAPVGSLVLITTDNGLKIKIKNEQNIWKDI